MVRCIRVLTKCIVFGVSIGGVGLGLIPAVIVMYGRQTMVSIIGATHPGLREHNEDCFAADSKRGYGVVADGMGGYACGEVASGLVKHTLVRALNNNEGLKEAIARAHGVVKAAARSNTERKGMGSTVIALNVKGADYEIAWVGDSRAYLWDGTLKQITRDHSYVERLLAAGAITEAETINHPNRNLITQAIGMSGEQGLDISVTRGRLAVGQQLMLCSDGLVDELIDSEIARLMSQANDPAQALETLIQAAVDAGGRDNITVLIADAGDIDSNQSAILPEVIRIAYVEDNNENHSVNIPAANDRAITGVAIALQSEEKPEMLVASDGGLINFLQFHYKVIVGAVVIGFAVASLLLSLA